jgi:hypothetical protein
MTHRIQLVDKLRELGILGPAAEIGVAEGNFSRDLLAAGIPFLYMVDMWQHVPGRKGDISSPPEWHHRNFDKAVWQTERYADTRQMLIMDSVRAAGLVSNGELSLAYLDADHSFEGVTRDLEAWYPKVRSGGIIAGHDYLNRAYGVYLAVQKFTQPRGITPVVIPELKAEDAGFYFIKP